MGMPFRSVKGDRIKGMEPQHGLRLNDDLIAIALFSNSLVDRINIEKLPNPRV